MRASTAITLFLVSSLASAAELGTLFHTAKEREQLERLRKGEKAPDGEVAVERPDPVITGYVKRSDGKSTVFIDKQPVPVRNPRLERRLQPKVVERFEPLPMPVMPADEESAPAGKSAPVAAKAPETQPGKPASVATPTAAPPRRGSKDE